jgi:DNA-binding NarL/FixJ family response regulator
MSDAIGVAVVEDHEGTRNALVDTLTLVGLRVVGAWSSAEAALDGLAGVESAVVLVDLELPRMSGAELIRRLAEARPTLKTVVLTVFEDEARILAAIRAGAHGYLLKDVSPSELRLAIEQAARGLSPVSPVVARHVLAQLRAPPDAVAERHALSEREREVLELLARGHTYASVGVALGISVGTVQWYVKVIYKKLDVASKAEATSFALRHGLVSRD